MADAFFGFFLALFAYGAENLVKIGFYSGFGDMIKYYRDFLSVFFSHLISDQKLA